MSRQKLFTSGGVAAEAGVPRWQFLYLLERGEIPGPSLEVPGRRLFTQEDVARIKQALAARTERTADQRKDSSALRNKVIPPSEELPDSTDHVPNPPQDASHTPSAI